MMPPIEIEAIRLIFDNDNDFELQKNLNGRKEDSRFMER
jgi:hypothetical protein